MFVVRGGSLDGWPQAPFTIGPLTRTTRWSVVFTYTGVAAAPGNAIAVTAFSAPRSR
jgi:hypothetical protein